MPSTRLAELRRRPPLEQSLAAALALLWLLAFALHVDLAVRGRLSWVPVTVSPAADARALPVVQDFWPETPEREDGLRVGDGLARVGERPLAGSGRLRVLADVYATADAEGVAHFAVERAGRPRSAALALRPYNAPWSFTPLILALAAAALALYVRRPYSRAARTAALACVAYSLHWANFLSGGDTRTFIGFFLHGGALAVTGPLALGAVFAFADRDGPGSPRRWRWLFLVIGPLHAGWQIGAPLPSALAMPALLASYALLGLCLLAAIGHTYARADAIGRRQLRWVVLGFYLGLAPVAAAAGFAAYEPAWRPAYEWSLLALLLIPICLTVALTRHNLFDVDRLISSAAVYSILVVAGVALLVGAVPAAAQTTSRVTGMSSAVAQAGFAILAAATLIVSGRTLQPRVEGFFFRERRALESGIRELRSELRRLDAPGTVLETIASRLSQLLQLSSCALYARVGDGFAPVFTRGAVVPPAFDTRGRLPALLEDANQAVDTDRWRRWGERELLSALEYAELESLDPRLVLPILRDKELAAFLCLGEKGSEDVYTSLDVALLEGLCDAVSVQLERFDAVELERAERERYERLAGYAPAALREELFERDRGGEPGEREVTVLFVDIRGYTRFAESRSPDEIFRVVNAYTTAVSRIVRQHGGWVVEFQGDGLMAVFGAPRELSAKEGAAVESALEVVAAVEAGIEGIADVPLRVGVGVATGTAYVGNVQSIDRRIWCVIGNTTNLAARLQALTRELDTAILVDHATWRAGGDAARGFVGRGDVRVKGRSEPIAVYAGPAPDLPLDPATGRAAEN